jgi:putative phosphoribosyl transferase
MVLFRNRLDAGTELSKIFKLDQIDNDPLVLGIPRGGIETGYPLAVNFDCPLEPIVLRKLPIPDNDQMGFGAVTLEKQVILNQGLVDAGYVEEEQINGIIDDVYKEVLRRDRLYRGTRPFPDLKQKCVIIVDDGLATGFTMIAAIRYAKKKGAGKIIAAVPVAHAGSFEAVEKEADIIYCLHVDYGYSFAVASFYMSFPDMTDSEVLAILKKSRERFQTL